VLRLAAVERSPAAVTEAARRALAWRSACHLGYIDRAAKLADGHTGE
jgi:hypothetical protein